MRSHSKRGGRARGEGGRVRGARALKGEESVPQAGGDGERLAPQRIPQHEQSWLAALAKVAGYAHRTRSAMMRVELTIPRASGTNRARGAFPSELWNSI